MKKLFVMLALLAAPVVAQALDLAAKEEGEALKALAVKETDIVMGDVNAPVQIVEYASMTCGHCANFHNQQLGAIKERFVDTGKVSFVLRDLPWDPVAQAVSAVARCAPADQYYSYVSAFMSTHESWMKSDDVVASIKQVARLGGMSSDDVDACLKSAEVIDNISKVRKEALDILKVKGTPTFFVNGQRVMGMMSADLLEKVYADLVK